MVRTVVRASVAGVLAVGAVLASAAMASASAPGERINSYDITVTVAPNGNAHVTETIGYDFGTGQRHGLTRTLPGRTLAGQATVTSPDGAPTPATTTGNTIRVGDPGTTVTGTHTYVLTYDLTNVVASSGALSWYVVDGSWDVPIATVTEAIAVPGTVTLGSCVAGGTACDNDVTVSGNVIHVRRNNITPHQTITVTATVPTDGLNPATSTTVSSYPTSSWNAATSNDSSSGTSRSSSAVGWVLGIGVVVLIIAIIAKAAGRS